MGKQVLLKRDFVIKCYSQGFGDIDNIMSLEEAKEIISSELEKIGIALTKLSIEKDEIREVL